MAASKKKYAGRELYEPKLYRVMKKLGIEDDAFKYDWSRFECYVEFFYKGMPYRFEHSVENGRAHGQTLETGEMAFAQLVLALEDLARMVERGIYDLSTWVAGMRFLPAVSTLPDWCLILQFDKIPQTEEELVKRYRQLAKAAHPDGGGSETQFQKLIEARDNGVKYFSART